MTATETGPLTAAELDLIDAWWRAANYLSVGQIYLLANPLLGEGLRPEDVKPRLLGHWGTTPRAQPELFDSSGTRVRTFVIAAREDKQIAAEVRSVLA